MENFDKTVNGYAKKWFGVKKPVEYHVKVVYKFHKWLISVATTSHSYRYISCPSEAEAVRAAAKLCDEITSGEYRI